MDTQNSILESVKKLNRIAPDDETWDVDIIQHINSVFADLNQLGVGPQRVFEITDRNSSWSDFIGENHAIGSVRTYMSNRVRLLFDPPSNSFGIAALQKEIDKAEWRLLIAAEEYRDATASSSVTLATLLSAAIPASQVTEDTA